MSRIYIDTNVFSNLRANSQPKFQSFNRLLTERKDNLSFFFSSAHIRDKRKDLSDIKFQDFDFMESFVQDNYLAYDLTRKQTYFFLATPKMVFDNDHPEKEFSDPFAFLDETDDDPLLSAVFSSVKELLSQPTNIDVSLFENAPEEQKKLLESFLPINTPGATILDQMKCMMAFTEDLQKDGDKYKELRTMIDLGMNNGAITLNGNEDFNEALKNTIIRKTYLEYVKDSMWHQDKENIPDHDFHIQVYSMLDVLGISKDKITKKNTFGNLQNDAYHSHFASYCDYFVTDDSSTIRKTKAVYDLLGINTKVVSVDEFIALLPKVVNVGIDPLDEFLKKLSIDYTQHERELLFADENITIHRLKENFLYLGVFDAFIEVINGQDRKIILAKAESNSLCSPCLSEIAQIIKRALQTFGPDIDGKLQFDYHSDTRTADLTIRKWEIHGSKLELARQPEVADRYALAIILPPAAVEAPSIMPRNSFWTTFTG